MKIFACISHFECDVQPKSCNDLKNKMLERQVFKNLGVKTGLLFYNNSFIINTQSVYRIQNAIYSPRERNYQLYNYMKTHLPKALFAAVLAAITVSTTLAKDYDVGTITGSANFPSSSQNYWTPTDGPDLTLSGTGAEADWLGAKDAAGNKITTFGKQEWTWSGIFGIGSWKESTTGPVSNNAKFGTLTIEDDAQVVLGGQYKSKNSNSLISETKAEYTGIIADKVVVNGSGNVTNLNTWNLTVDTLEVNSGNVEIHNKVQNGNNFFQYEIPDSKEVRIHKLLKITGGNTTINLNSLNDDNKPNDDQIFAAFGTINFNAPSYEEGSIIDAENASIVKSLLYQTGGKLTIEGKTASVGGLNIKQEGGEMNISTAGNKNHGWHIISDYGDSSIVQTGDDAILNIGGIKAYNNHTSEIITLLQKKGTVYDPNKGELEHAGTVVDLNATVSITQEGSGSITINQGIDLHRNGTASTEASSITQSGGGKIYLKGNYEGAVFNIEQKDLGGQIELHGSMSSDTVTQSSTAAKLNIKSTATLSAAKMETAGTVTNSGSMQVEQLEINSGSVTNEKNAVIAADSIIINGGVFTNNGTINKTQSQQMLMTLAADEPVGTTAIVINAGEYQNFGTTTQDIVVNGGILTLGANSDVAGVTMNSGIINVDGAATADALTLNGGQINFAAGATIDMGGADIALGSKVIITLNIESLDELPDSVTIFEGLGAGSTGTQQFEVRFVDANNQSQAGKINYAEGKITATIPEPASTTLSLLALAALAARRRRALAAA